MLVTEYFGPKGALRSIEKITNALKSLPCMTDTEIRKELANLIRAKMFLVDFLHETRLICNYS